jgi:hypothetical protein
MRLNQELVIAFLIVYLVNLINGTDGTVFDYLSRPVTKIHTKGNIIKFLIKSDDLNKSIKNRQISFESPNRIKKRDLNLLDKMKLGEFELTSTKNVLENDSLLLDSSSTLLENPKNYSSIIINATLINSSTPIQLTNDSIDLCLYSSINARVNECFQKNTNCK